MLLSASDKHPRGLANGSDMVGRHFMFHQADAILAIGKERNASSYMKTLTLNDFYFGDQDYPHPMGNIQPVGSFHTEMMKDDAPPLTPKLVLEMMTTHAVPWWLTTEDLPDPDNRVRIVDGQIRLDYTPNNVESFERLRDRWIAVLKEAGHAQHWTVGESPVWSAREQRLYWVDIQGKKIHRFDPETAVNETFELPEIVTSVTLRASGGLAVTLEKHFALFDHVSLGLTRLAEVEADVPGNRFNDGKCDPSGRYRAGTMDAERWSAPAGNLYRLDAALGCARMESEVICSNGSGWSPDGRTMYYIESFRYAIFAYDFDVASGTLSRRRTFVALDRDGGGFPDGMTVDAEGFVWCCLVGLGRIHRYSPEGEVDRVVLLPVPRATDCTFGGPTLGTLYVTSARETMTAEALVAAPLSGSLFAIDIGVRGLASTAFAG